jgi:hypothetical protein
MLLWVMLAVAFVSIVVGLAVLGRLAFGLARDVRHLGRTMGDATDRIGRAAADLEEARNGRW